MPSETATVIPSDKAHIDPILLARKSPLICDFDIVQIRECEMRTKYHQATCRNISAVDLQHLSHLGRLENTPLILTGFVL
jgi:hypothetical protein